MSYLKDAKVGDKFRWLPDGPVCRITEIKDAGLEVYFTYLTGDQAGRPGYTTLPQDIEIVVSAVDKLAKLGRFLPTEKDIGRAVVYVPSHGSPEDGVITGLNDDYVFVRYRGQHPAANGQATSYSDLRWPVQFGRSR